MKRTYKNNSAKDAKKERTSRRKARKKQLRKATFSILRQSPINCSILETFQEL